MSKFFSKFAAMLDEYLEYRVAMGITNRSHERHLQLFDRYCKDNYPDSMHLNKELVHGWIDHEISQGHRGLLNKISDIRMFGKYLGGDAYIPPHSLVPKKVAFSPYILTDDELTAFFKAADNLKYPHDPFIQETAPVLFRLLYTCGLRPREVRLIRHKDICFSTGEIFIAKSKLNKQRIVIMSDDMLDMCRSYNTKRAVVAGTCEYFFVRGNGLELQNAQVYCVFKRCWSLANPDVPKHSLPSLRPYDFRHRYASTILQKWLDEGQNLYAKLPYLRAYMGHERFSDTAYYIHILAENLLCSPGVNWDAIDETVPEVDIWNR